MGTTNLDSLALGGDLTVAGAEVITGGVTYDGPVTLGDTSADAIIINGTVTLNAPFTSGVNGTGHDITFYSATTGKSWAWDESNDLMTVTGGSAFMGNVSLGIDGTGFNLTCYGDTSGLYMLWNQANDLLSVTGHTELADLKVSGDTRLQGVTKLDGLPQTLSGAGAVNLTTEITLLVTGGADALTLADGAEGQTKIVVMKTDGGNGTLTPANFNSGSTITFAAVGETAVLLFVDGKWNFIGGTATVA